MQTKIIIPIMGILLLGAVGAFLFQALIFPWMLYNPYFERFEFIKSFKEGKIVVNPTEKVYVQENTALQDLSEKAEKSVVSIYAASDAGNFLGSGFVITSDGSILTLADLAPIGAEITVYLGDEKFAPKVIKRDAKNNLALLKIEKTGLTTASFANADEIKLGKRVFLLGINANTKEKAVSEGIIRSLNENAIKTSIIDSLFLRGSPLFDISGNLVGINIVDSSGKISAIPISKIKTFTGF